MKRLLGFVLILFLSLAAVGYAFNWYTFTATEDSNANKVQYGISIDKQKIEEDTQRAKAAAKDRLELLKGEGQPETEQ